MVSTQKIATDWLSKSNRFQAFPSCLEEEEVLREGTLAANHNAHPDEGLYKHNWIFFLSGLGWQLPGLSEVPT